MLYHIKRTSCILTILATTSGVALAHSVDVKVIGTITPTACRTTFMGGGIVDYGAIKPDSLKKDSFNQLKDKQLDFSIICDAPAKVAIKAITQRHGSAVSKTGELWSVANSIPLFDGEYDAFGLGLDNKTGVGGFGLRFLIDSTMADNVHVDNIISDDDLAWIKSKDGSLIKSGGVTRVYSWAKTGMLEPLAFKNLTSKLDVQAYINNASKLDVSKPIKLDGLATLELVYL